LEDGGVLIASASATASSGHAIVVWQWGSNKKTADQDVDGRWTTWKVVGFLMKVVVVIAALAYFVELIRTAVRNGNPSTILVANIHEDRKLGYSQRAPGGRRISANGSSPKTAMEYDRMGQVTEPQ